MFGNGRIIWIVWLFLVAMLLIAPSTIRADETTKAVITFNRPIDMPGMVLPADRYLFEVAGPLGVRNIVRITNPDGTRLFATVVVWDFRFESNPEDWIAMPDAAPARLTDAVRSWFSPSGENYGLGVNGRISYGSLERELAEVHAFAEAETRR
jgi:hypothetical protein